MQKGINISLFLPFFSSILSKKISNAKMSPVQKDSLKMELKKPANPNLVSDPKLQDVIGTTENDMARIKLIITKGRKNSHVLPIFLIPEYAKVAITGKKQINILKIVKPSSAISLINV